MGLTAAGLAAAGTRAGAQDKAIAPGPTHEACRTAARECQAACDEAFHHAYAAIPSDREAPALALILADDCARFCDLAASLIARQSPLIAPACAACAEACKACAAACAGDDSGPMAACARACRACEQACRKLVQAIEAREHEAQP